MKNIIQNRDGALLKVVLLGVALAMSLVMFSKVWFENSYEEFVPLRDRTYRLHPLFTQAGVQMLPEWATTPGGIAPMIKSNSPLFEYATRYKVFRNDAAFYVANDSNSDDARSVVCREMIIADSSFLEVFPRQVIGASMQEIAATTHDVLIARSLAEALSEDGDAEAVIGKMLRSNAIVIKENFTIKGVFEDFPKNSDLRNIEMIGSVEISNTFGRDEHNWLMGNEVYHSYVRLFPNVTDEQAKEAIDKAIKENVIDLYAEYIPDNLSIKYYLEKIKNIHTSERTVRSTTTLLLILGFSVLAIAMLNYVLFAVTALVKRAKNIATRRCYGAPTWAIYKMLISDALMILLLSLALAAFLIFALQPNIEELTSVRYGDLFTLNLVWIVAAVSILAVVVCGVIPAAIYAKIPLSAAFRRFKERNAKWKHALLALQFAGAMFFVSLLSILSLQYNYLLTADVGYDYDNLLYIQFERFHYDGYQATKDEVEGIAGVRQVARASDLPYPYIGSNSVNSEEDGYLFTANEMSAADKDLPSILGLNIIDGRDFDAERPIGREVLVSQRFVEAMSKFEDWSDGAVGKTMKFASHDHDGNFSTICGVYEDFMVGNATSLENTPSVIFFNETQDDRYNTFMKYLLVKVQEDTPALRAEIERAVKEVIPDQNIEVRSYSARFEESYSDSKKFRDLVIYAGLIVLIITLIGLVGYTRDEIQRRRAEVAIRKIHGATTAEIIHIFMRDIVWLLAFGIVAGAATSLFAAS
ncbi:MAG: ABC transporter permease, partial [Rikenellaceae bacterium]